MIATKTLAAINAGIDAVQDREHRTHLGASVLGRSCSRQLWYGFRWAAQEEFDGQKLRLFDRGNEFEPRAVEWLRGGGMTVWEVDESQPIDPKTGKHPQFRISDCQGHFGGSLDGIGCNSPDIGPGINFLCEFKTHNDASFKSLKKQGLCQTKNEHFVQMQLYMFKFGLGFGLYTAINKNDDHCHIEIVQVNPTYATTLLDKADRVIFAEVIPKRIKESPSFYLCKWCKFADVCHLGTMPEINCRTCRFSKPVAGGKWVCVRYGNFELSKQHQQTGCNDHQLIEGFLEPSTGEE